MFGDLFCLCRLFRRFFFFGDFCLYCPHFYFYFYFLNFPTRFSSRPLVFWIRTRGRSESENSNEGKNSKEKTTKLTRKKLEDEMRRRNERKKQEEEFQRMEKNWGKKGGEQCELRKKLNFDNEQEEEVEPEEEMRNHGCLRSSRPFRGQISTFTRGWRKQNAKFCVDLNNEPKFIWDSQFRPFVQFLWTTRT